jgi:hypothetical protein
VPLWGDASKRVEAHVLIKWLLPRRRAGGWPVDGTTEITIRELGCSAKPRLSAGTVMRVLDELHRVQDDTPETFERTYEALPSRQKPDPKPCVQWTFYFPLRANLHADIGRPKPFRILDRTFLFLRTPSVAKRLGKKNLAGARRCPVSLRRISS